MNGIDCTRSALPPLKQMQRVRWVMHRVHRDQNKCNATTENEMVCQKHLHTRLKHFHLPKDEYVGWKVIYVIGDLLG